MSESKKTKTPTIESLKGQIDELANDENDYFAGATIAQIGIDHPEVAAFAFNALAERLKLKLFDQTPDMTSIGKLGVRYPDFREEAFKILESNDDYTIFQRLSNFINKDWKVHEAFIDMLVKANNAASMQVLADIARLNPVTEKAFNGLVDMLARQDDELLKCDIKTRLYDIARKKGSEFAKRVIDMLIEQDFSSPSGESAAGSVRHLASLYKADDMAEYAINSLSRSQSSLAAKTIAAISRDTDSSRPAATKALEKMATTHSVAALAEMVGDDWDRAIETLPVLIRLHDKFNDEAGKEALSQACSASLQIMLNPFQWDDKVEGLTDQDMIDMENLGKRSAKLIPGMYVEHISLIFDGMARIRSIKKEESHIHYHVASSFAFIFSEEALTP